MIQKFREVNGGEDPVRNFVTLNPNCRFIFTCNFKNKIIEPLHSRTTVVNFNVRGKVKQELAAKFFERCRGILMAEDVSFSDKVVAEVIQKYFPDFRRTLNELQGMHLQVV